MPTVRLYVLDTGLIEPADFAMWSPNAGAGEYREMSVRSYLIVHPRGTVLWDTGIEDEIAELAEGRRIADSIVLPGRSAASWPRSWTGVGRTGRATCRRCARSWSPPGPWPGRSPIWPPGPSRPPHQNRPEHRSKRFQA